jgi:hypothetical protein
MASAPGNALRQLQEIIGAGTWLKPGKTSGLHPVAQYLAWCQGLLPAGWVYGLKDQYQRERPRRLVIEATTQL